MRAWKCLSVCRLPGAASKSVRNLYREKKKNVLKLIIKIWNKDSDLIKLRIIPATANTFSRVLCCIVLTH